MISVVVGIFINPDNGTILLVKRNGMGQFPGCWEFPGGQQEVGESTDECLERQLFQTFNSSCQVYKIFEENVYCVGTQEIKFSALLAKLEEDIQLSVHEDFKWLPLSHLLDEELVPAMRPIAEKIVNTFLG